MLRFGAGCRDVGRLQRVIDAEDRFPRGPIATDQGLHPGLRLPVLRSVAGFRIAPCGIGAAGEGEVSERQPLDQIERCDGVVDQPRSVLLDHQKFGITTTRGLPKLPQEFGHGGRGRDALRGGFTGDDGVLIRGDPIKVAAVESVVEGQPERAQFVVEDQLPPSRIPKRDGVVAGPAVGIDREEVLGISRGRVGRRAPTLAPIGPEVLGLPDVDVCQDQHAAVMQGAHHPGPVERLRAADRAHRLEDQQLMGGSDEGVDRRRTFKPGKLVSPM